MEQLKRRGKPIAVLLFIAAMAAAAVVLIGTVTQAPASVVMVYTYDINGVPAGGGSGYAALDQGIIVTNCSTVSKETYAMEIVTESGERFPVDSVLCYNEEENVALLRVPDCPLTPMTARDADKAQGVTVPYKQAKALYRSRTPQAELSLQDFYYQWDHIYTVDYILEHGALLEGQRVQVRGFVSAVDKAMYLTAHPEQILKLRIYKSDDPAERAEKRDRILTQRAEGLSLLCHKESGLPYDESIKLGAELTMWGIVEVYPENTAGPDIRLSVYRITAGK